MFSSYSDSRRMLKYIVFVGNNPVVVLPSRTTTRYTKEVTPTTGQLAILCKKG